MNFYISDLHIGHENVIRFDNRPFANADEMNDTIFSNWNSSVTRGDKQAVSLKQFFLYISFYSCKEYVSVIF